MANIDKIKIGSTTYNISPSWSNITNKPSSFTPASHTHTKSEVGLGNVDNTADANKNVKYATTAGTVDYFKYGRGVTLANSTSFINNFNKDIFGEETSNKFHLVELRTEGNAPSCLLGNYSSGIAWKGADTYGSLMVRWNYPQIRVSGGNGNNTDPKWTVDLIHSNNISSESIKYASSGLGRYDTITENSDGTYTINRQTGYILLDGVIEKNASVTQNGSTSTYRYTFDIVNGYGADGPVISNLLTNISFGDLLNNGRTGIAMYSATRCSICISGITTLADYKSHLAKNNIYIQYKLATSYTEKVEKNHYARYNERYILEHNRTEAGEAVNLFDLFNITDDSSYVNPEVIFSYENGGIIIPCGTETGSNNVQLQKFKNNKYIFSLGAGEFTEGFSSITFQKTSDFNQIRIKRNGSKQDYGVLFNVDYLEDGKTYTISADVQLRDNTDDRNIYCFHIMIVEGTKAVTEYYHYNAKKRISNNETLFLKNESDRSANVFNKDLPSLIYGTGYEVPTTANDWVKVYRVPVKGNTVYSSNKTMYVWGSSDGVTYTRIGDSSTPFRTESNTKYLCLCIYVGTNNATITSSVQSFSDLMLNEGPVALPYQPYEGKVIHEKELKNASTNLGYYDTITENADGTYTITKQTGYHNISNDLIKNGYHRPTQNGHFEYGADSVIHNLPIVAGSKNFINNLLPVRDNGEVYSGLIGISISNDGSCWVNLGDDYNNGEKYVEYLSKNNIYIQYKLPNARTEKVEKNYCAQYNKRFILEHNKIEAEKSSNLWSYENSITINAGSEKWWYLSHDTMVAWGFEVGKTYSIKSFVNNDTKDLAFQILPSYSDFKDGRTFVFTNDTQIRIGGNTVASTVTFTPKIMLVKGIDIADEYQPYSGAPIHKKEFENFKNSMKFIPYVSVVETSNSENISENGTYFVIPTNPSSASIKLEVKAGPDGTLQTAYFSGGIISVYRNYNRKFQVYEVKIVYGAGSTASSTYIQDSANYSLLPSGILTRVTGSCKIYKLI